jgi:crossover junction endodeoxyribonuclease RuvC
VSGTGAAGASAGPDDRLVLGIDPGTAVTGYGLVLRRPGGGVELRECGVIRTRAGRPLRDRIRDIFEGMDGLLARHAPHAVAVEDIFIRRNIRTALTLGHARGVILLAASLREVPLAEYTAPEVKKAVAGTGRATKDQVAYMVQQQLRLKEPPTPEDAADGVAVALCHCMAGPWTR